MNPQTKRSSLRIQATRALMWPLFAIAAVSIALVHELEESIPPECSPFREPADLEESIRWNVRRR